MKPFKLLLYKYALVVVIISTSAADWPKFGGMHGTFVSVEDGIIKNWSDEEPQRLWKIDVGLGFSSVVEANGFAYTQGYKNGKNTLFCVGVKSQDVVWKKDFPCHKGDHFFKGGSRTTPVVDDGRLFLLLHNGGLYCLDALNGKIIWSVNVVDDLEGQRPDWGFSSSPLVTDDYVILQIGAPESGVVALSKVDGSLKWKSGEFSAAYATPIYNKDKGKLFIFSGSGISVHEHASGKQIQSFQHKTRYGINASQPLLLGDYVLLSSAYGKGSSFINFSGRSPKIAWKTEKIGTQMASSILVDGFVYGVHGQAGSNTSHSSIFCLDIERGKILWTKKGYGLGSIIAVNNTLIFLNELGELILFEANPKFFKEMAAFQVLSGKDNWIPPSYANGKLHCRSSDGIWICLKMTDA